MYTQQRTAMRPKNRTLTFSLFFSIVIDFMQCINICQHFMQCINNASTFFAMHQHLSGSSGAVKNRGLWLWFSTAPSKPGKF